MVQPAKPGKQPNLHVLLGKKGPTDFEVGERRWPQSSTTVRNSGQGGVSTDAPPTYSNLIYFAMLWSARTTTSICLFTPLQSTAALPRFVDSNRERQPTLRLRVIAGANRRGERNSCAHTTTCMVARSVANETAENCDNKQVATANSHAARTRLPQTTKFAITATGGSGDSV